MISCLIVAGAKLIDMSPARNLARSIFLFPFIADNLVAERVTAICVHRQMAALSNDPQVRDGLPIWDFCYQRDPCPVDIGQSSRISISMPQFQCLKFTEDGRRQSNCSTRDFKQ